MNPPPMEKNVRSARIAPAASKAVNRRPLGCCVCAPGGNIWSRWKIRSRGSSNAIRALARELDAPGGADSSDRGFDCGGIDGGRLIASKAEKDGAIGCVAHAGESQRAVQVHLHARRSIKQAQLIQGRAQSGKPRASAPWYASWRDPRRSCRDRRDSWSRIRL